jgi:hypothetical protein
MPTLGMLLQALIVGWSVVLVVMLAYQQALVASVGREVIQHAVAATEFEKAVPHSSVRPSAAPSASHRSMSGVSLMRMLGEKAITIRVKLLLVLSDIFRLSLMLTLITVVVMALTHWALDDCSEAAKLEPHKTLGSGIRQA